MSQWFAFKTPIDLASATVGALVGFILVWVWNKLFLTPRVRSCNYIFIKEKTNFGILYKIKFKVSGYRSPGFCEMRINWCGNSVNGKWDDSPNPLLEDDLQKFEPLLVPQTFLLPVMLQKEYTIPILHENEQGALTVFSGWWFGRHIGKNYGPDPKVNLKTVFQLNLRGNDLSWDKEILAAEIISLTKQF